MTKTAMVCDDNFVVLRWMHDVLEAQGFQVQAVTTAADAMRSVAWAKPDVTLIGFQAEDGVAVVRALRENPECAGLTLIGFSAYAGTGVRSLFLEAGATDVLRRSFTVEEMLETVAAHVETQPLLQAVGGEARSAPVVLQDPPVVKKAPLKLQDVLWYASYAFMALGVGLAGYHVLNDAMHPGVSDIQFLRHNAHWATVLFVPMVLNTAIAVYMMDWRKVVERLRIVLRIAPWAAAAAVIAFSLYDTNEPLTNWWHNFRVANAVLTPLVIQKLVS